MNYQRLELTTTGQVATAKLNRPELFNAFSDAATGELEASVHSLEPVGQLQNAKFTFRNTRSEFRISSPTP